MICREVKKWSEKVDEEENHVEGGCATAGIAKCPQFCHVRGGDGKQGRTRGFDLGREGPVIAHAHVALESTAVAARSKSNDAISKMKCMQPFNFLIIISPAESLVTYVLMNVRCYFRVYDQNFKQKRIGIQFCVDDYLAR